MRQQRSWLEVVEWFHSSKGDALAALLSGVPLTEAAAAVAVSAIAAETPLSQLLPRCTPVAAQADYVARVLSCQETYCGLFIPVTPPATAVQAGAGAAEGEGAEAGPLGVALLLLQQVGESHLKETAGLLHAIASFALPVVTRRLLRGSPRDSETSRCIAEATHAALSSLATDCRRLIRERLETSISASLIGRLCCIVLHPLMLRAEWQIASVLTPRTEAPASLEKGKKVGKKMTQTNDESVSFAFDFARDLLAEGTTSLALSRAVVCKTE